MTRAACIPDRSAIAPIAGVATTLAQIAAARTTPISPAVRPRPASQTGQNGSWMPATRKIARVERRKARGRMQNSGSRHRDGLDGARISAYVAEVLIGVNQLGALLSVVIIDVVLAGDNAIVVGMAAAGLPPERRRRVIALGIAAATVLRILFAYFAVQLLAVIGLTLAGGVLLLWVVLEDVPRDPRDTNLRSPGGGRARVLRRPAPQARGRARRRR